MSQKGWNNQRIFSNVSEPQPCEPDCKDRNATCHATCKKWATWHEKHMGDLQKFKRKKYLQKQAWNFQVESCERSLKVTRKGKYKK